MATVERMLGKAIRRIEDPRFITGRGTYTDDLKVPDTHHAVFVRSTMGAARIVNIDARKALAAKGVKAVFTGKDLADGGVNAIPVGWLLPELKTTDFRAIAVDRVRHVGEAVAVVVADTAANATDAAELVEVDYEALPVVVDAVKALQPGAPRVHENAPDNRAFHWEIGDRARTETALKGAAKVVKAHLINQRLVANAIEPRASLARYDAATDELTLWVTSQNPHVHRLIMGAFVLGYSEHKFRVIAPDVGGGFGSKIFVYPEEVAVAWLAKKLRVPVKWTAQRTESFVTDAQGRDHVSDVEMGFDANGKVAGLRVKTVANLGAYLSLFAPAVPTYLYGTLLNGLYDFPAIFCEVDAAFTHTVPVDALRGAGRPEACYLLERTMDIAARELKVDPAELRRKNLIDKPFPFQTQVALAYDSGNYGPALERALKMVGYDHFRQQQADARKKGRHLGIGLSCYIEACGIAPSQVVGSLGAQAGLYESGTVRVHPTGKVTVLTGSHSHGQGHETTFSQLVSDFLGIPITDVEIVHGDTGRIPFGMGSYGSRSAAVGGTAIHLSLQKIAEKGRKLAAHLLEASPDDIELKNGRFSVKGSPEKGKAFAEVSLAAYLAHSMPKGMEPGLDETTFYDPSNFTFPFGTHIAVVEVDVETGKTDLLRYIAVDDVGNVINPMIVDGQLHGGITHGAAQALWEWTSYDDQGDLTTASLMEYGVPKADQLPKFETDRTVTPSPVNPLGVKGAGEAGAIAATPAVANAVIDALSPFGIVHVDLPLSPQRVWNAIQDARAKGRG